MYLNTSHVKVNREKNKKYYFLNWNLNTSHVKVNPK